MIPTQPRELAAELKALVGLERREPHRLSAWLIANLPALLAALESTPAAGVEWSEGDTHRLWVISTGDFDSETAWLCNKLREFVAAGGGDSTARSNGERTDSTGVPVAPPAEGEPTPSAGEQRRYSACEHPRMRESGCLDCGALPAPAEAAPGEESRECVLCKGTGRRYVGYIASKSGWEDCGDCRPAPTAPAADEELRLLRADMEWLDGEVEIVDSSRGGEVWIRFGLIGDPEAECPPLRELIRRWREYQKDQREEADDRNG